MRVTLRSSTFLISLFLLLWALLLARALRQCSHQSLNGICVRSCSSRSLRLGPSGTVNDSGVLPSSNSSSSFSSLLSSSLLLLLPLCFYFLFSFHPREFVLLPELPLHILCSFLAPPLLSLSCSRPQLFLRLLLHLLHSEIEPSFCFSMSSAVCLPLHLAACHWFPCGSYGHLLPLPAKSWFLAFCLNPHV